MAPRLRLPALTVLAVIVMVAAAGATGGATPTATPADVASPTPSGGGIISWEDAVAMIEACEVTGVGQTHAGDIEITLRDGRVLHGRQPRLDGILAIAGEAAENCGFSISMWTE